MTQNSSTSNHPFTNQNELPSLIGGDLQGTCDVSALPIDLPVESGSPLSSIESELTGSVEEQSKRVISGEVDTHAANPQSPKSPSVGLVHAKLPEDHELRLYLFEKRRTICLMILTTLAVTVALYVTKPIAVPIVLALLLSLTLRPVVRRLRKFKLPDPVGAGLIIALLFFVLTFAILQLSAPAKTWIAALPSTMNQVHQKLEKFRDNLHLSSEFSDFLVQLGLPAKAENASTESSQPSQMSQNGGDANQALADSSSDSQSASAGSLANDSAADSESTAHATASTGPLHSVTQRSQDPDAPIKVELVTSGLSSNFGVITGTSDFIGKLLLVVGLTFFFLGFGDSLLNNLLKILGTYSEKKRTVELVYEVEKGIASYLFLVTSVNIGLGLATGLAMWALGVPNAALWGALATCLNFIPVFGGLVTFLVIGLVSFLTFDSMLYALVPPLVFLTLMGIESNLITPPLLGRSMSLNPIVVFIMLVFWGWIWGIGGAFIAIPLLAACKIAFERFDITRPVATLIGE